MRRKGNSTERYFQASFSGNVMPSICSNNCVASGAVWWFTPTIFLIDILFNYQVYTTQTWLIDELKLCPAFHAWVCVVPTFLCNSFRELLNLSKGVLLLLKLVFFAAVLCSIPTVNKGNSIPRANKMTQTIHAGNSNHKGRHTGNRMHSENSIDSALSFIYYGTEPTFQIQH